MKSGKPDEPNRPTPGRFVNLLVCGELMGGTATATCVYVHVDGHSVSTGQFKAKDVRIWNGKRFTPHRKQVHVFDTR